MLKKVFKKAIPLFMATTMAFSMSMAFAAPSNNYTLGLKEGENGAASITIAKHLILNENAQSPNVTFTFKLKNAAGDVANNIQPGVGFATEQTFTVAASSMSNSNGVLPAELNGKVGEGQSYLSGSFTINFANYFDSINFEKPGIYRYELTEVDESATHPDIVYDGVTRYVDVYVENYKQGDAYGLQVASVIMHKAGDSTYDYDTTYDAENPRTGKNEGFVNEYKTFDLDVSKVLSGNQANMNDEFAFTITVDTTNNEIAKDDATYIVKVNGNAVDSLTMEDGMGTLEVNLGHNDKLSIYDLPYGSEVTVTEENGKYKATYVVGAGSSTESNSWTLESLTDDVSITFTNTLEGTIPTGVFLAIGPMIIVAIIGVAGMMLAKNKKEDDDE